MRTSRREPAAPGPFCKALRRGGWMRLDLDPIFQDELQRVIRNASSTCAKPPGAWMFGSTHRAHPMTRGETVAGTINGYVYEANVAASRPDWHFTPRVAASHPEAFPRRASWR